MSELQSLLPKAVAWYLVFLFSTCCHEAAHAWAALRGGDPTAYEGGQVSLNPVPHLQRAMFGLLVIPFVSFFANGGQWMIGWASAPYNLRWARRHPQRYGAMSLAGPAANFLLVAIAFICIKVMFSAGWLAPALRPALDRLVLPVHGTVHGTWLGAAATGLSLLVSLNVILGTFNLLPIPPLDGAGALEGFFPRSLGVLYDKAREQPLFGIVGLLLAWKVSEYAIVPVFSVTLRLLYG